MTGSSSPGFQAGSVCQPYLEIVRDLIWKFSIQSGALLLCNAPSCPLSINYLFLYPPLSFGMELKLARVFHFQECSQRANNGRFSLRDLLMVPMQRVLKYHLLLQVTTIHPIYDMPGWGGGRAKEREECKAMQRPFISNGLVLYIPNGLNYRPRQKNQDPRDLHLFLSKSERQA